MDIHSHPIAKILIISGIVLLMAGIVVQVAGGIPGFGKLPGDIQIKKENMTFYFPLTSCIIISIIMTIIFHLVNKK